MVYSSKHVATKLHYNKRAQGISKFLVSLGLPTWKEQTGLWLNWQ